ncbi:hypothetical protein LMG27177_06931 [Paraburkholderia fynbosensis]|uniref:DUF1508 domain-containing protein n=1 Tax=Paraburkholderia fynbosensis TaxID=1200993 RepID=A0A6J5H0Y8_9BURK|nr:hypothetical protein [Paraburkholderia fynbosensis]CAB3809842.1 hypothetical protein LMG27177_06931 [Paraburkholderia fynbosensis]
MVTSQTSAPHLTLHVFEQDGGWHWGIAIPRVAGGGFKVLAYSKVTFAQEVDAHHDGNRALDALAQNPSVQCGS